MMRRLLLSLALGLSLSFLSVQNVFAAHKVAEYHSSYFNSFYDIYADSAAENIYVFTHAKNAGYIAAIVLNGKEQIDNFTDRLDVISKVMDNSIKLKGKAWQVLVRYSVNGEWHDSMQPLSIRQTGSYVILSTKKLRDGKARQPKVDIAFTKDEMIDFIETLRQCYHSEGMGSTLPQDQNVIISY